MCNPIAVGVAVGAGSAALQGGDMQDIAMGAAFGAAGAGIASGGVAGFGQVFSSIPGQVLTGAASTAVTGAGIGATVGSFVTGSGMFAPPEFPTYDTPYQTAQVQQFNSKQIDTTGSGGRQAAASLAEAIQRSRQRKLSQEDVGDLSIDTSAFASTGLQLA